MNTLDERVRRVRGRQRALERRRTRRKAAGLLLICAALTASLVSLIGSQTTMHQTAGSTELTASSLLESSAGGYVLVAILAFMAGVAIAVASIQRRKNRNNEKKENSEEKES